MINIPKHVQHVLDKINEAGFLAYLVGGCVRDSLMGTKPHDWDACTDALPEQIKSIFEKTNDIGQRHGTVAARVDGKMVEVTTFRLDGDYTDHRHPDSVDFSKKLVDDLKRRDFTINAMAYSEKTGVIDFFDGKTDLQNGIVRCVGDPSQRFNEDALRILRCVRFGATLGFEIEQKTKDAMRENAELLKYVSAERIYCELTKILCSDNVAKSFNIMQECGILEQILPEFSACYGVVQNNRYHIYDVAQHSLVVTQNTPNLPYCRWAALLHDVGKPQMKTTDKRDIDHFGGHVKASLEIARQVFSRLRVGKIQTANSLFLIEHHDDDVEAGEKFARRYISKIGKSRIGDLISIIEADFSGKNSLTTTQRYQDFLEFSRMCKDVIDKKQCTVLSELAVTGNDIFLEAGVVRRNIGAALDELLECVLDDPSLNTREQLIDIAKNIAPKC